MPSGLFSNLHSFVYFGRALGAVSHRPVHLTIQKKSIFIVSGSACELLIYSRCTKRIMAASGSIVASGDIVVDKLVSNCGSFSNFVKHSCVYFSDRSYNNCGQARVIMRNREGESPMSIQGCFVYNSNCTFYKPNSYISKGCRSLSSISDGIVPEVSIDESYSSEHLSSLTISAEKIPRTDILKLVSGACYLPHPAKVEKGGEDAHFICVDEQAIGVADGVGGWADVGVDAGLYARELMSYSVKAIQEMAKHAAIDPLQVLEKAHAKTKAMGSSTACIVTLRNQSLHAINLGDSGFMVIRDGCIMFESPVQQHGFNFTYQLENSDRGDLPSSGQVFEICVRVGDVVVAGSDGLFDNLYSKEIACIVENAVDERLGPEAIAKKIADLARMRSLDRKCQTPFCDAAQKAGFAYYGGKLDDLTVVVSCICG